MFQRQSLWLLRTEASPGQRTGEKEKEKDKQRQIIRRGGQMRQERRRRSEGGGGGGGRDVMKNYDEEKCDGEGREVVREREDV